MMYPEVVAIVAKYFEPEIKLAKKLSCNRYLSEIDESITRYSNEYRYQTSEESINGSLIGDALEHRVTGVSNHAFRNKAILSSLDGDTDIDTALSKVLDQQGRFVVHRLISSLEMLGCINSDALTDIVQLQNEMMKRMRIYVSDAIKNNLPKYPNNEVSDFVIITVAEIEDDLSWSFDRKIVALIAQYS